MKQKGIINRRKIKITMKVIFLDVDGILTYASYSNKATADIDPEKVLLLKEICDRTGAEVVISSSWRGTGHHIPRIYDTLIDILKNNAISVLGNLPHIPLEFEGDTSFLTASTVVEDLPHHKIAFGTGRGAEVRSWLSSHPVSHFCILDDDDFEWADYGYKNHWIRPSYHETGLEREHVEAAVAILNTTR